MVHRARLRATIVAAQNQEIPPALNKMVRASLEMYKANALSTQLPQVPSQRSG